MASAMKQCARRFKDIRMRREAESKLSLKELVQQSVRDSNDAAVPNRMSKDNLVGSRRLIIRQALQSLRSRAPLPSASALVPHYSQQVDTVARGSKTGQAWLPAEFTKLATKAVEHEFEMSFDGTAVALAWVDVSYSAEVNNRSFAALGHAVLHLYARSQCVALGSELGSEHQNAAAEMVSNALLSKVFRGFKSSIHVLTSMETARLLNGHCFYGSTLGKAIVRHYPVDGPDSSDDASGENLRELEKATKIACYSSVLKALVGCVYLEHGLDAAVDFVNKTIYPRLVRVLDGTIK
ncbi:hypothetical protein DIPPA_27413 [Diplonema papillatum]|nr:hypothetical protein DIPPA_27413 [Diplonema papillatum]